MKSCYTIAKILFLSGIAFCLVILQASAQQSENSPYSRYGLGELSDNHFNHIRQMGGLGSAVIDVHQFNILNPASYAYLQAFSLDVGVYAKSNRLQDQNNTNKVWTGNIDYVAFAFPLRNPINDVYEGKTSKTKMGMAFALMPHSNVSYNILTSSTDPEFGEIERAYIGSGGSYKFLFGNGLKYKDFSIGLNIGYLFGKIDYQRNLDFVDLPFAYQNRYSTNYNINGFIWNAGLIYSVVLNKKQVEKDKSKPSKLLTFGVRGNSVQGFSTEANVLNYSIQNDLTQIKRDTSLQVEGVKGKGKLPFELGIGSHFYNGEKWNLGFDYRFTAWDSYANDANNEGEGTMKNTSRFALGGAYRPNYKSFDNFFERVFYRYGLYYESDPRSLEGKQLTGYGLSVGMGMPFIYQRKISYINLGAQFGWRAQDLPISERYVKISLGVTFNDDEWFLKSKYY